MTTRTPLDRPHPHVDPRQPRIDETVLVDPPVFVWRPTTAESHCRNYSLVVATDPDLRKRVLEVQGLESPMFLPTRTLGPGRYYWTWKRASESGQVWSFAVSEASVQIEVPEPDQLVGAFSGAHPRVYVKQQELGLLRDRYRSVPRCDVEGGETGLRTELLSELTKVFAAEGEGPHELKEPPYLPDRRTDFDAFWKTWYEFNWTSRRFMQGAELLGLAYLLTGDVSFGERCKRRLLSVSEWDPDGSSSIAENDEAHMSVFRHMPIAADFVWNLLNTEERERLVAHIRRRGNNTFRHARHLGEYGVTRFDSHAGREIVFLGIAALAFADEIPEAADWLAWLRPVLCGVWPIWGHNDGGWAEGPAYALTYVTIMTMFATAIKAGADVDLYKKPFWQNHADWRRWIQPPYAEWIGFGDHTERWREFWEGTAYLVKLLGLETGNNHHSDYAQDMLVEAESATAPPERGRFPIPSQLVIRTLLAEPRPARVPEDHANRRALKVFDDVGWAVVSTDDLSEAADVRLLFRSSPFGSISHSHAANNDFALHVAGKAMLIPSGYFSGFSSNHHSHWVWHTKSHNALTLGGAPQFIRSYDSRGMVARSFEDDNLTYFCGVADPSYAHLADVYRRHVLFVKSPGVFVVMDEVVLHAGVFVPSEWNAHAWYPFSIDAERKAFSVRDGDTGVEVIFLTPFEGYFSVSEGWDPAPDSTYKDSREWRNQFNLKYVPSDILGRHRIIPAVLSPFHSERRKPMLSQDFRAHVDRRSKNCIHYEARVGSAELRFRLPAPPQPGSQYGRPLVGTAVDKSGKITAGGDDFFDGPILETRMHGSGYRISHNGFEQL